jgi:hypothetical protein
MKNPSIKKTVSAVVILIVVGIFGWLLIRNKLAVTPVNVVPPVDQVVVLEPVDKEIKESAELYEVSIHYPYYSIPVIDDEINRYIDNARNEFVKSFSPADDILREMFTNGNKGFLTITYDIKKSAKISTVVFHGSQYTGGAHPTPFIITIPVDTNGKLLKLSDLFTVSTPEYLAVLSKYASEILSKEYGDGFFKEGADTNPENWNNWYIDENGNLVILFGAYQVAAYVNGEPDVSIPFSEIQSIAKSEIFK